jgi:hypothetical protein
MPYKDRAKRNDAVRRSQAKKPDKYRELRKGYSRARLQRGYGLQRRYGITQEDFETMLAAQGGGCQICGKRPGLTKAGRTYIHVDHCHTTGKVRGLLCPRCNTLVGYVEQTGSDQLFRRVREYLANYS